ncbi:MAG TPA: c-type cytochrome [Desulfuromonadaceae bacterium]|jgi:hypothetical protein
MGTVTKYFNLFGLAIITISLSASATNALAVQESSKNLQVLNKGMSKDELKQTMQTMSQGLGVSCEHCHDPNDMAKDTPQKRQAREMILMIGQVNKEYMKKYNTKLSCYTCHHGSKRPK